MISVKAVPRYEMEKAQLQELIVKMEHSSISDMEWVQDCIKQYRERIKRIDELIQQVKDYYNNPICVVSDQLLGEHRGSPYA